jgi:hypothetical protein
MRSKFLVSLFVIVIMSIVSSVAIASSSTPTKYTAEQVKQLSSTGFRSAPESKGIEVSVEEAVAASKRPYSETEVGIFNPDSPDMPNVCWQNSGLWFEWGTWPYQQRVNESRYWCANCYGCAQTYRTSHVTLGGGGMTLCNSSGAYGFRTGGGNGYTWTIMRSGGHFACPSPIPYITYHYDRWMEWACNTWGNCSLYDRSCTNCFIAEGKPGEVALKQ